MSITTEIQRINGGKSALRTLASQKNINIPSSALIDSYASVLGSQWPDCTFNVTYDGDKIRGKTMKWNQNLSVDWETYNLGSGLTATKVGNSFRITGTAASTAELFDIIPDSYALEANHKYLAFANCNQPIVIKFGVGYHGYENDSGKGCILNPTATFAKIVDVMISLESGTVYDFLVSPTITDLTKIFNAGNEPSSIDDPRIQFPIKYAKDHPEQDSGSLAYSFYKGIKLGEYDYIDTTNNKLVLGGAEVDISQMSLTRFLFGSNYLFYGTNNDQETNTTNIISADYETAASISDIPDMSVTGNGGTGKNLWFRDDSCTTVEQFKTKNTGKKVYYKLATPIEIAL